MIIDTHLHFGTASGHDVKPETLLSSMERYGIDFGLVSNLEACEYDSDHNPLPDGPERTSLVINDRTRALVAANPDKLKGLFWIMPGQEPCGKEIEAYLKENRERFAGLMVHPWHSRMDITQARCEGYWKLAKKLKLPVFVHTAVDDYSAVRHVEAVAKKYKDVPFILVHMGLGTDRSEAIRLMTELPNVYGDTTWVDADTVRLAVKTAGADKVLFGSDAPIDGEDTYQFHQTFFDPPKRGWLAKADRERILEKNAKALLGWKPAKRKPVIPKDPENT